MGVVDTLFVSKLGVAKVAAIGFANTFLLTLTYFFVGMLGTTRVLSARYAAQGSEEQLRGTFGAMTLASLAGCLAVSLPLVFFCLK